MAHSRIRHYYHVVWTTKYRLPLLLPEIEEVVFQWIRAAFEAFGCTVIRVNGMPDHIHVIVIIPGTLKVSSVYGHVKSKVSSQINEAGLLPVRFAWQNGVSSDTVSRRNLAAAIHYVEQQKSHHLHQSFDAEFAHLFLEAGSRLDPWSDGWERIPDDIQQLIDRGIHPIGLHKTKVSHILETTDENGQPLADCPPYERLSHTLMHPLLQPENNDAASD